MARNKKWTYLLIGLVVLIVLVLLFHRNLLRLIQPLDGGTPVIIKGGDDPSGYVEIELPLGQIPSGQENISTAWVKQAGNKCFVYTFNCSLCGKQLQVPVSSSSVEKKVYVDAPWLEGASLIFDQNDFDWDALRKTFKSKSPMSVKNVLISGWRVSCVDQDGKDCSGVTPDVSKVVIGVDQGTTCPP